MTKAPTFEKTIKRLLSTPPKPHDAPKDERGKDEGDSSAEKKAKKPKRSSR